MDAIIDKKPVEAKAKSGGSRVRVYTPPPRTLVFHANTDDEYSPIAGLLVLTVGKEQTEYVVSEFPTGWMGRGFTLCKLGAEGKNYDVFCSQRSPDADSCDCAGFTFKGKCKHRDAVRKLIEVGKL